MIKEGSSPEFFEDLDEESKAVIEHWNTKRSALLRVRIQQEMEAKLEEHDFVSEPSMPFVKVLVQSAVVFDDPSSVEAMLTIWKPSSEQLDTLRDGALLSFKNLDAKNTRFDGRIQLSGNNSTSISVVQQDNRQIFPSQSSGTYTGIFRLQLASKELEEDEEREQLLPDVSVMGIVFKATQRGNYPSWTVYLTDESNIRLRLESDATRNELDSFLASIPSHSTCDEEERYRVVAFRDLQLAPFDFSDNCAVVHFTADSRFEPNPSCGRAERLNKCKETDAGRKRLRKLALYADVGVEETIRYNQETIRDAIGYIAGFHVLSGKPQVFIQVDCGGPIQTWKLPLSTMSAFAATCDELDEDVVLNADEEINVKRLMRIGRVFRARQFPYRFTLKRTTEADVSSCTIEVENISTVDTRALAALYSTLLE